MSFLDEDPIPLDDGDIDVEPVSSSDDEGSDGEVKSKITMFGDDRGAHHETSTRKPNKPGTGASRVRTFVSKIRPEALDHLDDSINTWLNENPEYEVKFATVSVGDLKGKITEQAIIVNVWV